MRLMPVEKKIKTWSDGYRARKNQELKDQAETHLKALADLQQSLDSEKGLRIADDLSIVIPDHDSASWCELWKTIFEDLHDQIQCAHDTQRKFHEDTLDIAEQFAQAVFDAQGIPRRWWPELEADDLTSIKTWFACRGGNFTQISKRYKIAREREIFRGLRNFALLATGAVSFPTKLKAGCDLAAFERCGRPHI
jgi:hypothetical protein